MKILLTSAGRRVSLIKIFRKAITSFRGHMICAGDANEYAPAMFEVEKSFILPPISSRKYIHTVLDIAIKSKIDIIVPLLDQELSLFSSNNKKFSRHNVCVMTSNKDAIDVANDKLLTASFFKKLKLPTPHTLPVRQTNLSTIISEIGLPLLIKPRYGQRGEGIILCHNKEELMHHAKHSKTDIIAQEYLSGSEITIDAFGNGQGEILSLVPRKRLKIRAGEVERAVTIDDTQFREFILKMSSILKPFGAINVQCFITSKGISFTEINARFGGGYPLSHKAGAKFPELLIKMAKGEQTESHLGKYTCGLLMSRYDQEYFKKLSDKQLEKIK